MNYLKLVLNTDYMSAQKLGAVKYAEKSLEKAIAVEQRQQVPRPPQGWKVAMRQHIERVGGETLVQFPDIEPKDLGKIITKTYSYGSKSNYPYKVWREELKQYLNQVELDQLGRKLAELDQLGQKLSESYHPTRRRA